MEEPNAKRRRCGVGDLKKNGLLKNEEYKTYKKSTEIGTENKS